MAGLGSAGIEAQLGGRLELGVSEGLGLLLSGGAQRWSDGTLDPRDAFVGLALRAVHEDRLLLTLRPGLSLPLGAVGAPLGFVPLSTRSVDPWATATLVAGGSWLFISSAEARVPLYAGSDGVVQGPFGRLDVGGGRRLGQAVPWLGLSTTGRLAHSDGSGSFAELAAVGGATLALAPRWSLGARLRLPLVGATYEVAGGLSLRTVIGAR